MRLLLLCVELVAFGFARNCVALKELLWFAASVSIGADSVRNHSFVYKDWLLVTLWVVVSSGVTGA